MVQRPGTKPKLIHQNYKQVSMTWCKYCEAHKFFEEWFWCKMSKLATREVDTVSEITASICQMLTQDKSLSKHLAKTILSKLVNTSLILIFLGVLEQRFGEYVKTDFYIIWINVFLLWQNSFCLKKRVFEKSKGQFLMNWSPWVYNYFLIGPDWLVKTCSE